jgi:hypothetical protein
MQAALRSSPQWPQYSRKVLYLEDFEWRELPPTDEQAFEVLDGSPYSPTSTQTYREWRELGASIAAALIRAGEAAKAKSEHEKGGEQVGAANLG